MTSYGNQSPDNEKQTSLNETIERVFIQASLQHAKLSNILLCKFPGSKSAEYRLFLSLFSTLFNLSRHKKGLDEQLIKTCSKWLLKYKSDNNPRIMQDGLNKFQEYSDELFDKGVINND